MVVSAINFPSGCADAATGALHPGFAQSNVSASTIQAFQLEVKRYDVGLLFAPPNLSTLRPDKAPYVNAGWEMPLI